MLRFGIFDEGLHLMQLADVEGEAGGVLTLCLQFFYQHLQALDAPGAEYHVMVQACQVSGDGFADTATGTGDEDDFAHVDLHCVLESPC